MLDTSAHRFVLLLAVLTFAHIVHGPASAQDPNVQSRLEDLAPTTTNTVLKREVEVVRVPKLAPEYVTREVPLTATEMRNALRSTDKLRTLVRPTTEQLMIAMRESGLKATKTRRVPTGRLKTVGYEDKPVEKPPTVTWETGLSVSYGYNSNAFSRKSNVRSDRVTVTTPSLNVKIPVGKSDTLAFFVSSTSARYDSFDVLDRDIALGQITYSSVLSQTAHDPESGTKQTQLLRLKVAGRAAFLPFYEASATRTISPSVDWSVGDIPLSGQLCGGEKAKVNCHVAGVIVEVASTFFDDLTQFNNASAKLGGTLTWNILGRELTLTLGASVTGRHYPNFTGGDRSDVLGAASASLVWAATPLLNISAGADYSRQSSTNPDLDYSAYTLQPQIRGTLKF